MPPPTHSEAGQPPLKPYTSVKTALSTIPRPSHFPDPLHQPSLVEFLPHKQLTPWDDSKILPRAMTTSGGQNYHPSGTRDLTPREYATLQGFPSCHVFLGSYVKKQIGNAVPPVVAKVLFESIKRDLDAVDAIVEEPELIE
jgi:DNA (cytosine-5)-methyltransferase 1